MKKIIFICLVLMTTGTYAKCESAYEAETYTNGICGTDGESYYNMYEFLCAQKEEYGTRVNLQVKHRWPCFVWEKYGYETCTLVSWIIVALVGVIVLLIVIICRLKRAAVRKKETEFFVQF